MVNLTLFAQIVSKLADKKSIYMSRLRIQINIINATLNAD